MLIKKIHSLMNFTKSLNKFKQNKLKYFLIHNFDQYLRNKKY